MGPISDLPRKRIIGVRERRFPNVAAYGEVTHL